MALTDRFNSLFFQGSQLPINIFGDPENVCHRSTAETKERRGAGFIAFSFLRNRTTDELELQSDLIHR
jgi:hypothetical protein